MKIYVNSTIRSQYVANLKAFGSLKEALPVANKVIFATSARLLDPYAGTTPESREHLLSNFPRFEFNGMKRSLIVDVTNVGYSDSKDREILADIFVNHKLKPLEPHLHENNQGQIIKEDLASYEGAISMDERDGFDPLYDIESKTITPNYRDLFIQQQQCINAELPSHHLVKEAIIDNGYKQQIDRTGVIVFSTTILLVAAIKTKLISIAEAITFSNLQIELIASEIALAYKRKDKSEREMTSLLKVYEKMYKDFIEKEQWRPTKGTAEVIDLPIKSIKG